MKTRQFARVAGGMALFLPVCFLAYHLTSTFVGFFVESLIAPVGPWVIIDHFHVELYLEMLVLTACLGVRLRPWIVWVLGVICIPSVPVIWQATSYLAAGMPPLPHRTFARDAALWLAEGVSGGLVSCLAWQGAYRAIWSVSGTSARGTDS